MERKVWFHNLKSWCSDRIRIWPYFLNWIRIQSDFENQIQIRLILKTGSGSTTLTAVIEKCLWGFIVQGWTGFKARYLESGRIFDAIFRCRYSIFDQFDIRFMQVHNYCMSKKTCYFNMKICYIKWTRLLEIQYFPLALNFVFRLTTKNLFNLFQVFDPIFR